MSAITDTPLPDDEHAQIQQDECESLSSIFADEFHLHSEEIPDENSEYGRRLVHPISFSIQFQPSHTLGDGEDNFGLVSRSQNSSPTSSIGVKKWPSNVHLALHVTYPPNYPDVLPTLALFPADDNSLHPIQQHALFTTIYATAQTFLESGTPCIMSCVHSARDFFEDDGLASGLLHILSEDVLSLILSFVATTKKCVDDVVNALPIFEIVSKTDLVWKCICEKRWREKWSFEGRWSKALEKELQHHENNLSKHGGVYFWHEYYNKQEVDSARESITRDELCAMKFDYRKWFGNPLNQPDHLKHVIPSGLPFSVARDFHFTLEGTFLSSRTSHFDPSEVSRWVPALEKGDGSFYAVDVSISFFGRRSERRFTIHRLPSWGWELRSNRSVMRAVDSDEYNLELWDDYTKNLVLQEREEWMGHSRFGDQYMYRIIPNDDDLKSLIPW